MGSGYHRSRKLSFRWGWALVQDHPIDAESVAHLAEAGGKECLFHRHQDLAAIGKGGEYALGLTIAGHAERQISAAHWLGGGDIRAHQLRAADRNARVQHGILPGWVDPAWGGILSICHAHQNLAAEVLF